MDKVVFLDIDGVLNSTQYLKNLDSERVFDLFDADLEDPVNIKDLGVLIDPDHVSVLNTICLESQAGLVITSNWRFRVSLAGLDMILRDRGLDTQIPVLGRTLIRMSEYYRQNEIEHYLEAHPEIESFLILEDWHEMPDYQANTIMIDDSVGLVADHVPRALQILNNG